MPRNVFGGTWGKKGTKICQCGCAAKASARAAAAAACLDVCVCGWSTLSALFPAGEPGGHLGSPLQPPNRPKTAAEPPPPPAVGEETPRCIHTRRKEPAGDDRSGQKRQ